MKRHIPVYVCPSDDSRIYHQTFSGWADTSYASNFQVFADIRVNKPDETPTVYQVICNDCNDWNAREVSIWQSSKDITEIQDGLSNTLFLAESYANGNTTGGPGGNHDGGTMWARNDWLDYWQPTFAAYIIGAGSMFHLALFALLLNPFANANAFANAEEKPLALFNGKNLDGWVIEGDDKAQKNNKGEPSWQVIDGNLVCESTGFGFLRYKDKEFTDFVLTVEYKVDKGSNTGIGIRTVPYDPANSHATRPSYFSYEVQLLDDAGKPASKTGTASLYRYVAPTENASKPAGEWNTIEITCQGPQISIVLNGTKVLDVDQNTMKGLEKKPLKGSICLQLHHTKAEFRSVTVRELRARATP